MIQFVIKVTRLIIFSILFAIFAAACQATPIESPIPTEVQIGELNIRTQETEPDEIANILGIQLWKFEVDLPVEEVETGLQAELVLRDPQTGIQTIEELRVITTESDLGTLVAIYPIAESLFNAEQVRIYMESGSGSTSSVIANPFREFSASYTANPVDVLEDGSFLLMAFSDTGSMPAPDNTTLELRLTTWDPES